MTLATRPHAHHGADAMTPVLWRIASVKEEIRGTFTWHLRPTVHRATAEPFAFRPGQFNMLYVFGTGEVAISISGDPDDRGDLVHTIRAVGTVTRAMQRLQPGDTIGLRGPFGSAWPVDAAAGHDVVIVAGGIGLAPLRPVLHHVANHRERYRNVSLCYGARNPGELLYGNDLLQWATRSRISVDVTVDIGTDGWRGHVGLVTQRLAKQTFDPASTVSMMCGPEVMMRFAALELQRLGVPDAQQYMSMERNMKCAIGWCGHCMLGPEFICKDGPVYDWPRIRPWMDRREA
ncbi:MAG: FAD/NAD(P)-binding protein [Planctomycetota bacterium]